MKEEADCNSIKQTSTLPRSHALAIIWRKGDRRAVDQWSGVGAGGGERERENVYRMEYSLTRTCVPVYVHGGVQTRGRLRVSLSPRLRVSGVWGSRGY